MRAILVYGRSRVLPTLTTGGKPPLIEHPRFFVDVLYVHRKVCVCARILERVEICVAVLYFDRECLIRFSLT